MNVRCSAKILLRPPCRAESQVGIRARQYSCSPLSRAVVETPASVQSTGARRRNKQRRVFSAIQPTGVPHLGNYLGALKKWKELNDGTKKNAPRKLYFAIADLHALTAASHNRELLLQNRRETYASLLAIGLDPKKCVLFMQSSVLQHASLMWILSTVASTGYLSRMTQWKSKLQLGEDASMDDQKAREQLKLGLFSYPVLQAADILLYRPDLVPVGEDQLQHVEFARVLAKGFNAHFCTNGEPPFFSVPEPLVSPARRIMSLRNPVQKMSKSDPQPASRVVITDSAEEIQQKFRGAVTDSMQGITYDPENRPGVSNLVAILKHVTGSEATFDELAVDNKDVSMKVFKEHVASCVIKELDGIRDRFGAVMANNTSGESLDDIVREGAQSARSTATLHYQQIMRLAGLQSSSKPVRNNHTKSKEGSENGEHSHQVADTLSIPPEGTNGQELKKSVQEEQAELEENTTVEEKDVLPQKEDGVDRPIAS